MTVISVYIQYYLITVKAMLCHYNIHLLVYVPIKYYYERSPSLACVEYIDTLSLRNGALGIFSLYNCQCNISLPGTGSCYSIRISKL